MGKILRLLCGLFYDTCYTLEISLILKARLAPHFALGLAVGLAAGLAARDCVEKIGLQYGV